MEIMLCSKFLSHLYDSQEKILWSWHIWLTSDNISAETYYVSSNGVFTDEVAGVVMDRNLGALSNEVNSVDASMQTIDYTVANPHVFLFGNSRKDWIAEKNNTLWTNSTKTKYDPCPPGWRIPDGGTGLNAALKLVGVDGTYWTAAAIGGNHDYVFAMNFYFASSQTEYYAYCSTEVPRATGNSVRCCKE